jgi:hypothetical protein
LAATLGVKVAFEGAVTEYTELKPLPKNQLVFSELKANLSAAYLVCSFWEREIQVGKIEIKKYSTPTIENSVIDTFDNFDLI